MRPGPAPSEVVGVRRQPHGVRLRVHVWLIEPTAPGSAHRIERVIAEDPAEGIRGKPTRDAGQLSHVLDDSGLCDRGRRDRRDDSGASVHCSHMAHRDIERWREDAASVVLVRKGERDGPLPAIRRSNFQPHITEQARHVCRVVQATRPVLHHSLIEGVPCFPVPPSNTCSSSLSYSSWACCGHAEVDVRRGRRPLVREEMPRDAVLPSLRQLAC